MKQFLDNWMPPDYSAHGWQVDQIIIIVHWLMLILFVFWGAFFLYTLYRFNAKRNPKASYHGMRSHWSTWGEAGVAVVEVVLEWACSALVSFGGTTSGVFLGIVSETLAPPHALSAIATSSAPQTAMAARALTAGPCACRTSGSR